MMKRSILQEDVTIFNVYAPNNTASKYMRQNWENCKVKPNISKDIVKRNTIINQLYITDIYRVCHPTRAEYTFFSSSHKTFTKTEHILGYKTHLNKPKKTETIKNML